MAARTSPNQRIITIHREAAKTDFLNIKNKNWQAAARDLGAHGLMLYLYLASNINGFNLVLSPAAITQATGMPRSTYHDQFSKLVNRGYLVQKGENEYDFFEIPCTRPGYHVNETSTQNLNTCTGDVHECPGDVHKCTAPVQKCPAEDIQIIYNNINNIRQDAPVGAATQEGFVF